MWNREAFLDELRGLLRIPTVYDASTVSPQAPCGQGIAAGLDFIRRIALRDGFTVREYGGRALAICYGEQQNRVEAVSHVDVVPVGEGWSVPPFGAVLRDGRLYGRGTQDMKTALWLSYEALRRIRAEGRQLKRQIRLVIGTDEERTMRDVAAYLQADGLPDFAFTPDGGFPLCLGEKGDLVWYVDKPVQSRVLQLTGGQAANVVCDSCALTVTPQDAPAVEAWLGRKGWVYETRGEGTVTFAIAGKAAHASQPHLGDNAIVKALTAVAQAFGERWARQLLKVFQDPYGSGMGLRLHYPPMGNACVGLHVLSLENGRLHGVADVRYPLPLTALELTALAKGSLAEFTLTLEYDDPPCLQNLENPFIKALLAVYRKQFPADETSPYISGGVTYAKVYGGRCVAFGPRLPFDTVPALAHQADEYTTLEHLDKICATYADALTALSECEG